MPLADSPRNGLPKNRQIEVPELKHTTTLFALFDHDILSWEGRVVVDQIHINYHGRHMRYDQSDATELLIIKDPHYGRMCFKSVKTLEALHS